MTDPADDRPTAPVRAVRSSFRAGEGRRALVATALGVVLGLLAAIASRPDRNRSTT